MLRNPSLALLALACSALLCSVALSQSVPGSITHQGRVLLDDGSPLSGSFRVECALLNQGALVWQQSLDAVPLNDGFFAIQLGPQGDAAYPLLAEVLSQFDALQLSVSFLDPSGTRFDFLSEQPLSAVPYAVYAARASHADSASTAEDAIRAIEAQGAFALSCNDCLTTTHLAPESVTSEDLAARSVTTGKLADSAVDRDKIADQSISPEKVDGALYNRKDRAIRYENTISLNANSYNSVEVSCGAGNELPLFGECWTFASNPAVLVNFGYSNLGSDSQPATYTCSYRNTHSSTAVNITARIYCIPSNN
ncbi:MAG: hypothetical protein RBU37_23865 [Myxococcota bacterium]|jgi:hypothetical protein|nr:hypothetical protein [Myxococcota bacterium]